MSEPFQESDVLFRIAPPERDRENPMHDVPEEYAVIRNEEASCGLIVFTKYHGEWEANRGSHRWLIGHLLKRVNAADAILDPLNELREQEGSAVTVLCDNQDFNGLPDRAIEVSDDWTGWDPMRFGGNTLAEALGAAIKARDEWNGAK